MNRSNNKISTKHECIDDHLSQSRLITVTLPFYIYSLVYKSNSFSVIKLITRSKLSFEYILVYENLPNCTNKIFIARYSIMYL